MLNQLLYNALVKAFKSVEISNEDQHAEINVLPNGSGAWTLPQGDSHGEQYAVRCPFCDDRHKHLYISYLSYTQPIMNGIPLRQGKLRAHCFRCHNLENPDKYRELDYKIARYISTLGDGMQTVQPIICDDVSEPTAKYMASREVSLEGLRSWIPDWQEIDGNTDPVIMRYLRSRNVSAADVAWLRIGWGPIQSPRTKRYINGGKPWVLFPIINNGKLVGVQGRCPDELLSPDTPKYYFHPGCRKQTVLYNLDMARSFGIGVVCEGVFDVLSVGKPGICCFGHTPSILQKRLLSSFTKGLIWLPDTDIREDLDTISMAQTQVDVLNSDHHFELGAYVVVLPKKDAGEMTRQQVWDTIRQNVPESVSAYVNKNIIPRL